MNTPYSPTPAGYSQQVRDIVAHMEQERQEAAKKSGTERNKLAIEMQAAGVNQVTITFSGGGDSGQVDEVQIVMADGFKEPADLKRRLTDWAYQFLEGVGVDWYNNEGGQGELCFDLTKVPAAFSGNVAVNYTESKTEWSVEDEMA